jgi:hypothetical protein
LFFLCRTCSRFPLQVGGHRSGAWHPCSRHGSCAGHGTIPGAFSCGATCSGSPAHGLPPVPSARSPAAPRSPEHDLLPVSSARSPAAPTAPGSPVTPTSPRSPAYDLPADSSRQITDDHAPAPIPMLLPTGRTLAASSGIDARAHDLVLLSAQPCSTTCIFHGFSAYYGSCDAWAIVFNSME